MSSYDNNDSGNGSNSVYRAVRARLMDLEFRAFQTCVVLWLGKKGYRHLRSLGRRSARGRRKDGGADFIATLPGASDLTVAIQLRHRKTPIQRTAVDELRGFMLRSDTPLGLIVGNSTFFPQAIRAALEFPGRPVRLVSVAQLAGSMVALGLGVKTTPFGYRVDETFFRTLDCLKLGLEPASTTARPIKQSDLAEAVGVDTGGNGQFSLGLILLVVLAVLVWLIVVMGGGR